MAIKREIYLPCPYCGKEVDAIESCNAELAELREQLRRRDEMLAAAKVIYFPNDETFGC